MAKKQKIAPEEPLEKKLWKAADKLRKNMDAAEYKHVALGLIFLKYISDAFEELHQQLVEGKGQYEGANPEDRNEYLAEKVFYVPPSARWTWLQGRAKLPTIGKDIDDAMDAIEKDNPTLKGVLPKVFAQEKLDKGSLGGLVDLISTATLGTKESQSKDVLGRVFEYFLGEFALAEGKKGGQFYTPASVVKLLVEMLEPYEGRVFDPCCGSGGMFVQSEKFIKAHQDHYKQKGNGKKLSLNPADHISIYGQESNQTTWRLARMNLAIRGIDSSNVKWNNEGSFLNDAHKDLKADFIIANPPFNDSDWSGDLLRKDGRWIFGVPPTSNANFGWIQHFIYHLSANGTAGFLLANSSLDSESAIENEIRKQIVDADLVDCIVTLPGKLFYSTPIPVSIWFLSRNKKNIKYRERSKQILFIDGSKLGKADSRTNSSLAAHEIKLLADTFHNWRNKEGIYNDVNGFCRSVGIEEVREGNYSLFPAKYIAIDVQNENLTQEDASKIFKRKYESYLTSKNSLEKVFSLVEKNIGDIHIPKKQIKVSLSKIFTPSEERLGTNPEPEILTCTEKAGLIFQKDRFAKRVATDDTSKYMVVRKTDVVYNPYLLWAGAIDMCWIVDIGITSPAYEVLRLNDGFDATLIGLLVRSERMIKMYDGISVGTVQRRRRAPVEKFLDLEIVLPSVEEQTKFSVLSKVIQTEIESLRDVQNRISDLLKFNGRLWLNSMYRDLKLKRK